MKNPVFDKDLTSLLKNCDNLDLDPIVETILSLPSQTLLKRPEYQEHAGDHKSYVDAIVYEITSLGGHTIANLVRGHGVAYADMVRDVAEKLDIDATETDTVATLEERVILRVLRLGSHQMSDEDRLALADLLALESEISGESEEYDDSADDQDDENDEDDADERDGLAIDAISGGDRTTHVVTGEDGDRDYDKVASRDNGRLDSGDDESFPEAEVSRRLADSATALAGDRIFTVVDHVARTTRVRRTMVAASKVAVIKALTSPLGGALSWAAAIGRGLHDLMGPNYAASLGLVAHIGLLRQKYQQMERDLETGAAEEASIALT